MANLLGWLGSLLFAVCGVPQVVKCVHDGNADGVSFWFLFLWWCGEVLYIASVLMQFGWVGWMMFNYFGNLIMVSIILRYYLFPRRIHSANE